MLVQGYGLDLMDCSDGSLTTGLRSFVDGVKEHVLRFGEAPDADSEAARQTRDFLKLVRQVRSCNGFIRTADDRVENMLSGVHPSNHWHYFC